MARRYRLPFRNPYLEDASGKGKYHLSLVMEDAKEMRIGRIKSKAGAFQISREELTCSDQPVVRPSASRFEFDLESEGQNETITVATLEAMQYSPSYRPKGQVGERVADTTISRLRYQALAGRKSKPPRDLSFLSDAENRRSRQSEEQSSALRRDTRRSDVPIEKRRAALLAMLPPEQREQPEKIAQEVNERREREEKASGRIIPPRVHRKRFDEEDFSALTLARNIDDPTDDFRARELEEKRREDVVPVQEGMGESTQQLPEFYSETRYWSRINSENPTWSEIQQNTVTVVPKGSKKRARQEGRYVADDQFDPNDRYRPIRGVAPRRMPTLFTEEDYDPLHMDNPYAQGRVLSAEEIRGILNREERTVGTLEPPEGLTDPELLAEWYRGYSALYRTEEDATERERYLGMHEERQSPPPQIRRHIPSQGRRRNRRPDSRANEQSRYEQYRQAERDGYERGRSEGEQMMRREQEARRRQEMAARQRSQMYAPRTYSQPYPPQGGYSAVQPQRGNQQFSQNLPPRRRNGN